MTSNVTNPSSDFELLSQYNQRLQNLNSTNINRNDSKLNFYIVKIIFYYFSQFIYFEFLLSLDYNLQ